MTQPERIDPREQFNRQAAHYDRQWNDWNQESLNWILDRAGFTGSERVLDVATGGGFTALACAPRAAEVTALDVATAMLEQGRRRAEELGLANMRFVEGAAESLSFPDESFDVVTCRIAPHHFHDVAAFARESRRVLRGGGRFLLADSTVPDQDPTAGRWQNEVELLRDPSHHRNLTPNEWRAVVEAAGLNVLAMESTGGGITIPITDWLRKSGCTGERAEEVRRRFAEAPPEAVHHFQIHTDAQGETVFTWQRVLLLAVRG